MFSYFWGPTTSEEEVNNNESEAPDKTNEDETTRPLVSDDGLVEEEDLEEAVEETPDPALRSLDEYLEEAYESSGKFRFSYWILLLSMGVANSSDATEVMCLSSAVFFGMLLGGLVVGNLGDLCGRRPMLLISLWCNAVTGALSALSQDVYEYTALRTLAGIGIGASIPPLFTIVSELAPPSRRGFCVAVVSAFWMVGAVFVALIALATLAQSESWRIFAVICAVPSTLAGIMVGLFMPESPRYLAIQQKHEASLSSAERLGRKLGKPRPLSREELEHHYPSNDAPSWLVAANARTTNACWRWTIIACEGTKVFFKKTTKLYTRNMLRITLPIQVIWTTLCFGSYGISTWIYTLFETVHLKNLYINALLFNLANLPANILTALLLDRLGRRNLLFVCAFTAAACLLVFAYFASVHPASTLGIVLSACFYQAFVTAAWNTINALTSERFPTLVRSTGLGVSTASGRIGAMIAQFVNGALVSEPAALLCVASGALTITAFAPFFPTRT